MDRREIEDIERFLTSVGKANLFGYYGVALEIGPVELEETIKKRRSWAQGQQSNPKFKSEAMFLIKNNNMIRRVLLEDGDAYREHLQSSHNHRNLDVLSLFIRGTLAGGVLTQQAEAAIHYQGRQLDLTDVVIARRIDEILREIGGTRSGGGGGEDGLAIESTSIDYYELFGVTITANLEQIEAAYRSRYRWARSLKDLKKSAEVLQALDMGWRILKDPARRQQYNDIRAEMQEVTDEVERHAAMLMGLLGSPETQPDPQGAPSGTAPSAPPTAAASATRFTPPGPPVRTSSPPPDTSAPPIRLSSPPPGGPAQTASNASQPAQRPVAPVPVRPTPAASVAPDASRLPSVTAPPPTAQISGRTLGIADGPQAVRTRGPRLSVAGPDTLTFKMSGRLVRHNLVIRNVGQGKMPGKVTSDREWLEIARPKLDPLVAEQAVGLTLAPERMPWGRSSATLTVITDHGERKSLHVVVTRRSAAPFVLGGALVVFTLGLAIAAMIFVLSGPAPRAAGASLKLHVDSPADRILINGEDAGGGENVEIMDPSRGDPFRLRIEADGFATHEELVTLLPGRPLVREVTLLLEDEMAWSPPAGAVAVELGDVAENAVRKREAALATCFAGEGVPVAEADYVALVSPDGTILRVDVTKANYDVEKAQACVKRSFRATRLPTFTGDYGKLAIHIASPVVTSP